MIPQHVNTYITCDIVYHNFNMLSYKKIWYELNTFDKILFMSGQIPPNVDSEGDESDFGPPYLHDLNDFGGMAAALGALQKQCQQILLSALSRISRIFQPLMALHISAVLENLPVPQRGKEACISMQEAIAVCCLNLYIIYYILCNNRCIYVTVACRLDTCLQHGSKGTRQ